MKSITQRLRQLLWWQKTAAVLLTILVVGLLFSRLRSTSTDQPAYQTVQVEQKDLLRTLSVTGSVAMGSQFGVSSSVTGVVEEIYVKNGDEVKTGQVLFKVRSTATAQEKASAYAAYQNALNSKKTAEYNKSSLDISMWQKQQSVLSAQNNVNEMESNLDNYTDLERQTIYSARVQAEKDYALAEQRYTEADSSITAASASLNSALLAYQATQNATITAPTAGVIANMSIQEGDAVTASNTSTTSNGTTSNSTTAMYVTNFSDVVMKAAVNEVDLPNIEIDQKATITIDAFPDQTFVGTVTRIDRIGVNSSGVVSFNVYITLLSPPAEVGSGMTASAVVQLDLRQNVLSVSSAAIQSADDQQMVRVLKEDGSVESRAVETGLVTDTETEVTSGLQAGETIITGTTVPSTANFTTGQSTSAFSTTGRGGFGGSGGGGTMIRMAR